MQSGNIAADGTPRRLPPIPVVTGPERPDSPGLMADLNDADIEWILSSGLEQQVIANTILVAEGQVSEVLYLVLDGLLEVRVQSFGEEVVARIGPGEIVGEMSFLENKPASATVRACENSLLLVLPRGHLDAKAAGDATFAARLCRSFARVLSQRLRAAQGTLGRRLSARAVLDPTVSERRKQISIHLDAMKRMLVEADRQAIRNDDQMPEAVVARIRQQFRVFCDSLNEGLGDPAVSPDLQQELGAWVQQEILPYMMLTKNGERWYRKPRGYAGDFLSIEWIYRDNPEGAGRLGPVLDRCFLDMSPAQAVRNRRRLLVEEIQQTLAEAGGTSARVLSMGSGPARELFDTFEALPDPDQIMATCLDIDLQALAFVADLRDRRKLKRNIRLENCNLMYLVTGRQRLELAPQDLAYSIGLIDYFNDNFVVRLLDFVHDHLRPGGRVILGNFHPRNSGKAFMDHVLDWRLIHRDEADMNRLFRSSKFGRPCEAIRYEGEGINLFAIGRRAR